MSADFDLGDWRPVPQNPRFEVNFEGRVRNARTKRERKQFDRRGYRRVIIERKYLAVHRLVAAAFLETDDSRPHVNHRDGDKANNHVSNLEWVTRSENLSHAVQAGLLKPHLGERNGAAKLTSEQILEIRQAASLGSKQTEIARRFGVSQVLVSKIVRKEIWSHVRAA